MGYSDQQLRDAVDAVFGQFDKDGSNTLDPQETYNLICAAAQKMGGQQPSQEQVQQFVQAVDKNGDGKIQKQELYQIFRKVMPE
jgi:Ca2+-binding EF-hand superfamily protein